MRGVKICLTFTKATSVLYFCGTTKEEIRQVGKKSECCDGYQESKKQKDDRTNTHIKTLLAACLVCVSLLLGESSRACCLMGTEKSTICIGHVICCYVNSGQSRGRSVFKAGATVPFDQWEANRDKRGRLLQLTDTTFNICSAGKPTCYRLKLMEIKVLNEHQLQSFTTIFAQKSSKRAFLYFWMTQLSFLPLKNIVIILAVSFFPPVV